MVQKKNLSPTPAPMQRVTALPPNSKIAIVCLITLVVGYLIWRLFKPAPSPGTTPGTTPGTSPGDTSPNVPSDGEIIPTPSPPPTIPPPLRKVATSVVEAKDLKDVDKYVQVEMTLPNGTDFNGIGGLSWRKEPDSFGIGIYFYKGTLVLEGGGIKQTLGDVSPPKRGKSHTEKFRLRFTQIDGEWAAAIERNNDYVAWKYFLNKDEAAAKKAFMKHIHELSMVSYYGTTGAANSLKVEMM